MGKQRGSADGRPVTDLYEIPALMEAALDLVAIEELREAALHVIHQAAGIGQKSRGPEGAEMKEALLGVACKLGGREGGENDHQYLWSITKKQQRTEQICRAPGKNL